MFLFRSCAAASLVLTFGLFSSSQLTAAQIPDIPILERGLVVESISKNTQGERLGVRKGDLLLTWKRGSTKGDFNSPFDFTYVFLDQADRSPITIEASRDGRSLVWVLGSDTWGLRVRPNFKGPLLSAYQ